MKKIFLFLSLIIGASFFAQNRIAEIETQFRDYNQLIVEKKFEKALDLYANEDFLKLIPKKVLIESMNQMFNTVEIDFRVDKPYNMVIDDELYEEKGKKFAKIDYEQKIEMKFNESDLSTENLLSALQSSFGFETVKYNKETGYFEITSEKRAVASSTDETNWKFSMVEKKMIPILKQFIPERFLKELK